MQESTFQFGCRSSQPPAAVALVPPRPFGAPRAGSQPPQLFQPSAPSASAAASETSSPDRASATLHTENTIGVGSNAAVLPAPMAYMMPQGRSSPSLASSSSSGAATHLPFSAAAAAGPARHNPYTQRPGAAAPTRLAGMAVPTAAREQSPVEQSTALTPNQHSSLPTEGPEPAQPGYGGNPHREAGFNSEELVTTYSSFGHDPGDAYAGFGVGSTVAYSAAENLQYPVGSNGQAAVAVLTAHQDGMAQHGNSLVSGPDDMTELQL